MADVAVNATGFSKTDLPTLHAAGSSQMESVKMNRDPKIADDRVQVTNILSGQQNLEMSHT